MKRLLLDGLGALWVGFSKAAVYAVVYFGRFMAWVVGEGSREKRMADLERRVRLRIRQNARGYHICERCKEPCDCGAVLDPADDCTLCERCSHEVDEEQHRMDQLFTYGPQDP